MLPQAGSEAWTISSFFSPNRTPQLHQPCVCRFRFAICMLR
jgi:hypothetical protein